MDNYDWLDEPYDEDCDAQLFPKEPNDEPYDTVFVYTYHLKTHIYIVGFPERPIDYTEAFIDLSIEGNIPRAPRSEEIGEYIADLDHELLEQIGMDTGFPPEMLIPHHDITPMF